MPRKQRTTFTAFLSHRYKSAAVNSYFFSLFRDTADVSFEVDVGMDATSVTRLERKIRGVDAFVGIFPYAEERTAPDREDLRKASRYFRLELDIAARARKPALLFVDARFGTVMDAPSSMVACEFDHQEVGSGTPSPSASRFRRRIAQFCRHVGTVIGERAARANDLRPARDVGILLPGSCADGAAYTPDVVERLVSAVREVSREPCVLPWPPVLDARTVGRIDEFDWVVTDVGAAGANGLLPFLHGRGVPTVRLHAPPGSEVPQSSDVELALYGAHDVGYPKDVLRWQTADDLVAGFRERLQRLDRPPRRIASTEEALEYFRGAAKRNEAVFVSYAGQDREPAKAVVAALKDRFQEVFDYRDGGESLQAGSPWLEQIFERLARSAIGVALLSRHYLESGYCMHEANAMIDERDGRGRLRFVPVKLREEPLALPPFMNDVQYVRFWEHRDPTRVADLIVEFADRASAPRAR